MQYNVFCLAGWVHFVDRYLGDFMGHSWRVTLGLSGCSALPLRVRGSDGLWGTGQIHTLLRLRAATLVHLVESNPPACSRV